MNNRIAAAVKGLVSTFKGIFRKDKGKREKPWTKIVPDKPVQKKRQKLAGSKNHNQSTPKVKVKMAKESRRINRKWAKRKRK